ncbi:Swt1 family HEPN domain-containing protein [Patulibacter minatonensis]|uniref:Swt1 family HEPN domain-containing protein n=1 Tax=Patulibacter minatonensis TaxID=298163 RepID=UPI000478728D|nr:Swt1 family HEPN domain-containing protein [Patulibacter minatonensis]
MSSVGDAYQFVFRGLLTEEALDRAGRRARDVTGRLDSEYAEKLSLDLLDEELVAAARRMATVYTAIAAFENSARDLVVSTMIESKGEHWWGSVKADVRNRAEARMENEAKHKFHAQRGDAPLNYTDLKDLLNIIRANWDAFEAFLPSPDWTSSVFDAVERSRNVIMHSGQLGPRDVERVGIHLRDWVTQVGA